MAYQNCEKLDETFEKKPEDRLLLLDAGSLIHPAFHVLRGLSTSDGRPTGAIYGFTRTLLKLLRSFPSRYVACCFDAPGRTFRHEKYEKYKATRPKMADNLIVQIPFIKDIIRAFGISIFEKVGYEADDIIATLAKEGEASLSQVLCVTSDKDLLQLVNEKVFIIKPQRRDPKKSFKCLGPKEVEQYLGVPPPKVPDFLALKGDSSDNIPGIPYVGKKRAFRLLDKFGSIQNVLDNRQNIADRRVRESVEESLANVRMSLELVKLDTQVPLNEDDLLKSCRRSFPNTDELIKIFEDLEFETIIAELDQPTSDNTG